MQKLINHFMFHISNKSRWHADINVTIFMPPPQLGGAGDIMFYVIRPCVRMSVRASFGPFVIAFPRYLWFALMDFNQTFVSTASWDKDELIRFSDERSKVRITAWPNVLKTVGGGAPSGSLSSSSSSLYRPNRYIAITNLSIIAVFVEYLCQFLIDLHQTYRHSSVPKNTSPCISWAS